MGNINTSTNPDTATTQNFSHAMTHMTEAGDMFFPDFVDFQMCGEQYTLQTYISKIKCGDTHRPNSIKLSEASDRPNTIHFSSRKAFSY
jgi:hypothetical protein